MPFVGQTVTVVITDPVLKKQIRDYRKRHSILIPRIAEDALRYFFAHNSKQFQLEDVKPHLAARWPGRNRPTRESGQPGKGTGKWNRERETAKAGSAR